MSDLDKFYGPGARWDDPEVQDDMKNRAMAVFRKAVDGKEVKPTEMKAAETIVSRGILRTQEGPKQLTIVVGEDKLLEAKKKAGLLPIIN